MYCVIIALNIIIKPIIRVQLHNFQNENTKQKIFMLTVMKIGIKFTSRVVVMRPMLFQQFFIVENPKKYC